MNKKIIAVFCAVILMASVFTACGKKKGDTVNVNGVDYVIATDEEGSTMLDEYGNLGVFSKDSNGKFEKDENGKRKVIWVPFPNSIIKDNKLETKDLAFTAPEGWKVGNSGSLLATSDDETMRISISKIDMGELNYISTLAQEAEKAEKLAQAFKDEGAEVNLERKEVEVKASVDGGGDAISFEYIFEEEGKKEKFNSVTIYFLFNDTMYKAFYQCNNVEKPYTADEVAKLFDGLTLKTYLEPAKVD